MFSGDESKSFCGFNMIMIVLHHVTSVTSTHSHSLHKIYVHLPVQTRCEGVVGGCVSTVCMLHSLVYPSVFQQLLSQSQASHGLQSYTRFRSLNEGLNTCSHTSGRGVNDAALIGWLV